MSIFFILSVKPEGARLPAAIGLVVESISSNDVLVGGPSRLGRGFIRR
jgi:hypothetical protein